VFYTFGGLNVINTCYNKYHIDANFGFSSMFERKNTHNKQNDQNLPLDSGGEKEVASRLGMQ